MEKLVAVSVEEAKRVAWITVSRPQALNALNRQLLRELEEAFVSLRGNDDVEVLILTGEGEKSFVAGADIAEMEALTPRSARQFSQAGQRLMDVIENCPKPVIAGINGFCLGGGCELALACHLRVASSSARFGQPEVKLGLIPGFGGTVRLARLVGRGAALRLLLTGEMIDAAEAFRVGLVDLVVEAGELPSACRELAGRILANGPLAVRYCLEAVVRAGELDIGRGQSLESALFGLCFDSRDCREGMRAFLEKRPAKFKGE